MRIIVITQGNLALIDNLLQTNNQVVGVVQAAPRKKQSKIIEHFKKPIAGIYYLLNPRPKTMIDYAKSKGIPYYYLDKEDMDRAEEWFRNLNPDIIVVSSMSHLLRKNIINIPKYGVINYHHSYLPDYRGPNPLFWMYYDYVLDPGVTVHYIDEGEDTGDIIYQGKVAIETGEPLTSCLKKSDELGYRLLRKAIEEIQHGKAPRITQPTRSNTVRARNIEPKEYRDLINWREWGVQRIWHFLRGTPRYSTQLLDCNDIIKLGYSVEIESFSRCDRIDAPLGYIVLDNDKSYIPCIDGKIHVKVNFSLIRLIKRYIFCMLGGDKFGI